MSGAMIDRFMKMERINLYLSEHVEEPLAFTRGEAQYGLLAIDLETGEAYIEVGEGIGTLPPLQDTEIEALYEEVLGRYHTHLGHGA
jgi:fructose-1,6-bisphosphatase